MFFCFSLSAAVQIFDAAGNCIVLEGPACIEWSLASVSKCTDLNAIKEPPSDFNLDGYEVISNKEFTVYYKFKKQPRIGNTLLVVISSLASGLLFFFISKKSINVSG